MKKYQQGNVVGGILVLLLAVTSIAAWLTHVISCLMAKAYLLLLVGALVFPVGVIHGIAVWLGASWA